MEAVKPTQPSGWKYKVIILTAFSSKILVLSGASLIAFGIIALLLYIGVTSEAIEKAMVWLSFPWFTGLYIVYKKFEGKMIKIPISLP
ncbi:MAG: hypothetical protein M0Z70_06610 [Nitrospiraceae bacterium]|jgi:antibiotic biosynthesis monooxygenase (ABM) superfamily enzyme|nr:hypothetical protein [Nitrospirota bacterium]MDA8338952.1 hypothetical protein [Nitrospiraceae bacterium]